MATLGVPFEAPFGQRLVFKAGNSTECERSLP